jgi:hypothetical protein
MISRCEHCGQTVLATDSQCWHCGKALTPGKPTAAKRPSLATAPLDDTQPPPPPFRTILLYVSLTAVTFFMLIATTRSIGQAPLLLVHADSAPPAGWQPITDSQLQFTLNLPETWQTFELNRAPEAPGLRSSPPLQALSSLFDALVADTELLLLGTEDTAVFPSGTPVFVLVAQSQRLQRLKPDEIIPYLQQQLPENVTLAETARPADPAEANRGSLLFNIEQDEQVWRCLEQVVPGSGSIYLVVTCTSFTQFPRHQSDFDAILGSFQPLGS